MIEPPWRMRPRLGTVRPSDPSTTIPLGVFRGHRVLVRLDPEIGFPETRFGAFGSDAGLSSTFDVRLDRLIADGLDLMIAEERRLQEVAIQEAVLRRGESASQANVARMLHDRSASVGDEEAPGR
jgi:hypothetical protein